ncbi:ATP-dependent DNA helicase [Acidomonas methanolica]|nr:ATP-dependent DNA helicase [Acidomonas methanolica]MBU2653698.1 ATP-dependent DNA helicase [Acidomonas methanolica]
MPAASSPSPFGSPALIAGRRHSSILTADGELIDVATDNAMQHLVGALPLLVHAPATMRVLGIETPPARNECFDLLELFLFVSPGQSATPTPRGLALALDLPPPATIEADFLHTLLNALLLRLRSARETPAGATMRIFLPVLSAAGWIWTATVEEALGPGPANQPALDAVRIWRRLPKWEDEAPRPPPSSFPVTSAEARARLAALLGPEAETRPGQADFASVAAGAFDPRRTVGSPHLVLAEAGTGTGKTLGYVAPASLWAERNGGTVWISTYTRHLQRQIEQELTRLHPDPAARRNAVVVRKGRENYLCLLNMEDAVNTAASRGDSSGPALIALALLARWAEISSDGDLLGGDLPGWFGELFGAGTVFAVADRRGECIHGACPHYQRCFVEHTIRRARVADLVIANHALVMAQAAWTASSPDDVPEEDAPPTRYVFDEGHHLPDAADGAFALVLSGLQTAELRRWLLGAEGSRSRARGIARRLEDLVATFPALDPPLNAVLQAARALPAPGWSSRLRAPDAEQAHVDGLPANPAEAFLAALKHQLDAREATRAASPHRGTDSECDLHPADPSLADAAEAFSRALNRLTTPLETLIQRLHDQLEDDAENLDSAARSRIEGAIRALRRRALNRVQGWIALLDSTAVPPEPGERPVHVDFIRAERLPGRGPFGGEHDIGLHRHWLDPTLPFAAVMRAPAHGLLITSATLRDQPGRDQPGETGTESEEAAWAAAETRLGATHFPAPAIRAALMSPFDYARQTRAYVIADLPRDDLPALAGAYRDLFLAAGGGALGLFTAISRLRAVHARIAGPLDEAGLPLYAQHVDAMDNATLIDIFRTEIDSCLLGTDAMRDGVDVPGEALRMVVFERTPWPRADILHRERRLHLSHGQPGAYDDRLARMKLRQAFGRLIRKTSDRGVFVMLDRRMPSRLAAAFPKGVTLRRMGISEAIADIRDFLDSAAPDTISPSRKANFP